VTDRSFTPQQATRTLPLVRLVVEDAVRTYRRLRQGVALYRRLRGRSSPVTRAERVRAEIDRLGRVLDGFRRELDQVGCLLKDYERGIVDFPARRNGRDVELCWRLGEEEVTHWHELGSGYFARRPLEAEPVS
jgi:hypothetical protein